LPIAPRPAIIPPATLSGPLHPPITPPPFSVRPAVTPKLPGYAPGSATCQSDCSRLCRFVGSVPAVEPGCYGTCIHDKGIACGRGASRKDQPIHGRYCGYGNRGGRPIDALDDACRRHDNCWGSGAKLSCTCDRTLAAAAALIASDPFEKASVREKAGLVAIFFNVTPCW
jgi:hypothetical protein